MSWTTREFRPESHDRMESTMGKHSPRPTTPSQPPNPNPGTPGSPQPPVR